MDFGPVQQFGFPPYGFMPGPIPAWGFNGPYPQFPPNPQFALQSNQWVAPQQQQQGGNQQQQQHQSQSSTDQTGKKTQTKAKKKLMAAPKDAVVTAADSFAQMNYTSSICMCCGEPGHHQTVCTRPKFCFICKATSHPVDECPVRKRPHQMAKYVGSAATGLGFYHIELPEVVVNPVASTKNCGVVIVEGGIITRDELAAEFSKIYKTNWPWQIRELGQSDLFLVKFPPPHITVEQVIGYPRFGLSKEGVWVKIEAWADDPEPAEILSDIWIKVTGLLSKWCE
jgi:hypothetical protein